MLDASFALMNQYSAISAANETATTAPTAPVTTTENVETTNVTVENVAAAKVISTPTTDVNMPGTSADAKKRNQQEDLIKIEDLGSDDQDEIRNVAETAEASELRRRRLQKFLQTEQRNE